jgi:hypothetical protein
MTSDLYRLARRAPTCLGFEPFTARKLPSGELSELQRSRKRSCAFVLVRTTASIVPLPQVASITNRIRTYYRQRARAQGCNMILRPRATSTGQRFGGNRAADARAKGSCCSCKSAADHPSADRSSRLAVTLPPEGIRHHFFTNVPHATGVLPPAVVPRPITTARPNRGWLPPSPMLHLNPSASGIKYLPSLKSPSASHVTSNLIAYCQRVVVEIFAQFVDSQRLTA